jgi:hypothetical protein
MGLEAFGAMRKRILSTLMDEPERHLEKRSNARIEQLIVNVNVEKAPQARERKTGHDVAPRLLGSVPFSEVRKDRHKVCLELELMACNVEFAMTENFTNTMKKLKQAKKKTIDDQ